MVPVFGHLLGNRVDLGQNRSKCTTVVYYPPVVRGPDPFSASRIGCVVFLVESRVFDFSQNRDLMA